MQIRQNAQGNINLGIPPESLKIFILLFTRKKHTCLYTPTAEFILLICIDTHIEVWTMILLFIWRGYFVEMATHFLTLALAKI